jgi:ketosteroid isomerase-like protein
MLDQIQARDWDGTAALLAPDLVVEWVVTGETFRGPENFVAVQREYPEGWNIEVLTVVSEGTTVVSEIEVPQEGVGIFRGVSFWRVEEGLVVEGREYWSSPASEDRPVWRAQYSS